MKTNETPIKLDVKCSCGKHVTETNVWEQTELGVWWNCPTCHSTGLIINKEFSGPVSITKMSETT